MNRFDIVPVRVFALIYMINHSKTHENPVQIFEYKPNSRLIKLNRTDMVDMLL